MKSVTIFITLVLMWFSTLALTSSFGAEEIHSNCCLCMCRAKDETKCSRMCIRLQHGKKIVEEPEMKKCTKTCERKHVEQVQYDPKDFQ